MYEKGIDVSKWQGVIDWDKVKADGIEFAMLRAGYTLQSTHSSDQLFNKSKERLTWQM